MPIIQAWVRGGGREGIFRMLTACEAIPHALLIRAADPQLRLEMWLVPAGVDPAVELAADFAKHADQFVAECLVQRSR